MSQNRFDSSNRNECKSQSQHTLVYRRSCRLSLPTLWQTNITAMGNFWWNMLFHHFAGQSAHTAVDSWNQRCHFLYLFWRVFPLWPELCPCWIPHFFQYILLKTINPFKVSHIFSTECKGLQKRTSLCLHIHIKHKHIWRPCDICGLIFFPLAASTRLQPHH